MLKLHTFGGVFVERNGTPLVGAAGQRRILALLAIVAAAPGHGVSRDRLLGLLWPEADTERARHALTQALYNARRGLGDDDLFIAGSDIRLNPTRISTDVGDFVKAIEKRDDVAAANEYKGPFLEGFFISGAPEFEQWAALVRARLCADAAGALDRLATAAELRGETERLVEIRRQRVTLDPLDSGAVLGLMNALATAGDVTGAIRHARVHEALLRQHLDLTPPPEIQAFATRLKEEPRSARRIDRESSLGAESVGVNGVSSLPPAAVSTRPHKSRSRRLTVPPRWPAVATASLALMAVVAVTVSRGRAGTTAAAATTLGTSSVMVAPFRVAGADPSLAYLREGIVELLSARLSDDPSRPAVDPAVVLGSWQRSPSSATADMPLADAARLAQRLGAHTVVIGSVVGSPSSVLVTASLVGLPDGTVRANETVQGPVDSLSALVDHLAVRLLAADAGEGERLPGDRAPPLFSLKAYLNGQAAYRRGRFAEAIGYYERALDVDSTFALAAFRLSMAADRLNAAEQHDWPLAVAWKYRESLSKRDQAHLMAFAGPRYPSPSPESEQLAAWKRAAALAPDRAEVWQELGERFFYDGPVMGAADWPERAALAFRRTLTLDPAASMARAHLILLAARARDSVALDSLATTAALADSVGELTPFLTWRVANARNHVAPLRAARESWADMDAANLRWIAMSSLFDAVGAQDGERALRLRRARSTRAADELDVLLAQHSFALNQGRPILALDITEQLEEVQPDTRAHLRLRVLDALYADGDRPAAERAAVELERFVNEPPASSRGEAIRLSDLCVLAQWHLAKGDSRSAPRVIARLRHALTLLATVPVATPPLLCAEILDASYAVATRAPNAHTRVQRLDSLMLTGPAVSDAATYAYLVVAQLYERLGEPLAALDAIRRRGYMSGWPRYLATARRDEGRLALVAGDTSAATDAYRRYLTLRHDAEPPAKRGDESVARLLAALTAARTEPATDIQR